METVNRDMYRKGVSALIINNKNEFLLVNLESFETRFFAVPGGGLEAGENMEQAVYREIKEELGISKQSLEYVDSSSSPFRFDFKEIKLNRDGVEYAGSERYFFGFQFTGNDDDIQLQSGEVRTYKWVPYVDLAEYLLFDNQFPETIEKIAEIFPYFAT